MKFITMLVIMLVSNGMSILRKQMILELFPDYKSLKETVRIDLISDIKALEDNMKQIFDLKSEVKTLKEKVEKLKHESLPAFSVALSKSSVTLSSSDDLLKFDTIILNKGSGYDTSTGIFRAPRDGLYQFSLTVTGWTTNNVDLALFHNGDKHTYVYVPKMYRVSSTVSPVIRLRRNHQISVACMKCPTSITGSHLSHMSGVYIGK